MVLKKNKINYNSTEHDGVPWITMPHHKYDATNSISDTHFKTNYFLQNTKWTRDLLKSLNVTYHSKSSSLTAF